MSVFIAISVVDTFALENQFDAFMLAVSDSYKSLKNFVAGCKMMHWIPAMSQICSSYFVLLFTVERFISVRFPLKRAIICTKRRINFAVVSIVVIAAVVASYELHCYEIFSFRSKISFCVLVSQLSKTRHFCPSLCVSVCLSVCLSVTLVIHAQTI